MSKRIGILGSGVVGQTLANGLKDLGYEVSIGNRTGHKVDNWDGDVGTLTDVAAKAELIILTLKGTAAEQVVKELKAELADKTVIDTTNPIADKAPDEGVLSYFTSLEQSLMELLQLAAPNTNFVKAFNSVGNASMVKPSYKDGKPTMFICGNSGSAKDEVIDILSSLGWDSEDMGGVKSARAIEPLCMLWCIPGMLNNKWSHAFKLLNQ